MRNYYDVLLIGEDGLNQEILKKEKEKVFEMKNILDTDSIYRLTNNRVIMESLVGGTVETVKSQGFALFVGEIGIMEVEKLLSEEEAIAMIHENYCCVCDAMDMEREIVWVSDISTHNEVTHLIDTIQKYGGVLEERRDA